MTVPYPYSGYTCPTCGMYVYGGTHICTGSASAGAGVWVNPERSPAELERIAVALERIAGTLEGIRKGERL